MEPRLAAGILLYRLQRTPEFLLINDTFSQRRHWTPPKGPLSGKEDEVKCALRETAELTGLHSKDIFLESREFEVKYLTDSRLKQVKYFLAQISDYAKVSPSEGIQYGWFNPEQCFEKLMYRNMQDMIRQACEVIQKIVRENLQLFYERSALSATAINSSPPLPVISSQMNTNVRAEVRGDFNKSQANSNNKQQFYQNQQQQSVSQQSRPDSRISNENYPPNDNAPQPQRPENHLYKTRLCARFEEGHCPYGAKCSYAHGISELRERITPAQPHSTNTQPQSQSQSQPQLNKPLTPPQSYQSSQSQQVHPQSQMQPLTPPQSFQHHPQSQSQYPSRPQPQSQSQNQNQTSSSSYPSQSSNVPQRQTEDPSVRNPLYKTRLCAKFMQDKFCQYGPSCHFAHGEEELRPSVPNHVLSQLQNPNANSNHQNQNHQNQQSHQNNSNQNHQNTSNQNQLNQQPASNQHQNNSNQNHQNNSNQNNNYNQPQYPAQNNHAAGDNMYNENSSPKSPPKIQHYNQSAQRLQPAYAPQSLVPQSQPQAQPPTQTQTQTQFQSQSQSQSYPFSQPMSWTNGRDQRPMKNLGTINNTHNNNNNNGHNNTNNINNLPNTQPSKASESTSWRSSNAHGNSDSTQQEQREKSPQEELRRSPETTSPELPTKKFMPQLQKPKKTYNDDKSRDKENGEKSWMKVAELTEEEKQALANSQSEGKRPEKLSNEEQAERELAEFFQQGEHSQTEEIKEITRKELKYSLSHLQVLSILLSCLLSKGELIPKLKTRTTFFKEFLKGQDYQVDFLRAWDKFFIRYPQFETQVLHVIKHLYDDDMVEEDSFLVWEEKFGNTFFRQKADLFFTWLKTADETSE